MILIKQVYGKLLQEVYFRLDGAMQAFFRRMKNGENPGFPRVRPRHNFFTLIYPALYLKIVGKKLILPTGGKNAHKQYPNVEAKLTEEAPQGYREVAISRDARGAYFASFSYRKAEQEHQSGKKRNKQQDSLHKASHLIASKLVERTVVIGDLSQRQMVTNEHQEGNRDKNRVIYNDWGLYSFIQMLVYKCQLSGKALVFLDERNTSKACSGCGHLQAMPLWKRTYGCAECGLVIDRDENSAINILMRFLARLGPHTGEPVRCADVFTAIDDVSTFTNI